MISRRCFLVKNLGTSSIIVAAFVGPGTVLTCASAGVRFSYDLAWVLIFATAGVFVLQTFTAGTGILGRKGLGEAIRQVTSNRRIRIPVFVLVVLGLWIGSAAFETGNLVGASAGLNVVFGDLFDPRWWSLPIVLIAGAILLLNMRAIRNALTALIMLMSLLFIGTMLVSPVDWGSAIRGLVVPSIPEDSIVTIIALTGTTIVTYNLFLHASATKAFWADQPAASSWRRELFGMGIFLPLGGLISLAILFAGATIFTGAA